MAGRRVVLAPLVVLGLVATACGGGGKSVDVTLQEFAVGLSQDSADAGSVTFEITNNGPSDAHEFVVVRTDLAIDQLPTVETGAVDEEGEGIEIIGEQEEIAVGNSETLTLDLEAGSYVLICNIFDEDEQESHYQEGMRAAFTVD